MTKHTSTAALEDRVASLPWPELHSALDVQGFVQTPTVLSARECSKLAGLYESGRFRSTVVMARHRFGEGEYKYFANPLPDAVARLRAAFYPPLAEAANRWAERLGEDICYPDTLDSFLQRCHRAGQTRPTVLERPGRDFEGGEFVLLEQRPRAQSRAHVRGLERGAFLIFSTRQRPVQGSRGFYRAAMRHGVSTLTAGRRTTLGIIFHDAA